MKPKHLLALAAAVTGTLLLQTPPALAQAPYPDKPIRLVVPYPPGGTTDLVNRLVAQKLSESLGQTVIVENKPGANGNIGTDQVARSAPDGYTLLSSGGANTVNVTLYRNFRNDPLKDTVQIAMVGVAPNLMVVPNDSPAHDVEQFVAWAKSRPGGIHYASSGTGATTHLTAELFKHVTGTPMTHVPYKGSAPALTELIAGSTSVMFDNVASALQQVRSGKLKALASTGTHRLAVLPQTPTLKELGYPVVGETWFGLAAPPGTPEAIVARLHAEVRKIIRMPDVKAILAENGVEPREMDREQLRRFTADEIRKWADVIRQADIRVE